MKKKNQNLGFTLIEIMVVSLIALPMLILLMRIVPGMLRSQAQTELSSDAVILAAQKMEEIRRQIASSNPAYGFSRNYNQAATSFASPFNVYQFSVTDDLGTIQKQLTVTVWKEPGYSVSLATRAAKKN